MISQYVPQFFYDYKSFLSENMYSIALLASLTACIVLLIKIAQEIAYAIKKRIRKEKSKTFYSRWITQTEFNELVSTAKKTCSKGEKPES